jgi:hypothetical protein
MSALLSNAVVWLRNQRNSAWETLIKVAFGSFIGGLVLLLVALYSGLLLV